MHDHPVGDTALDRWARNCAHCAAVGWIFDNLFDKNSLLDENRLTRQALGVERKISLKSAPVAVKEKRPPGRAPPEKASEFSETPTIVPEVGWALYLPRFHPATAYGELTTPLLNNGSPPQQLGASPRGTLPLPNIPTSCQEKTDIALERKWVGVSSFGPGRGKKAYTTARFFIRPPVVYGLFQEPFFAQWHGRSATIGTVHGGSARGQQPGEGSPDWPLAW